MKDRKVDLDALLAQVPYLEDAGFTDALMRRLPRSRPSLRVRTIVELASAVGACAIVAAVPGARELLADIGSVLFGGASAGEHGFVATAAVVALVLWGAVAAAAES